MVCRLGLRQHRVLLPHLTETQQNQESALVSDLHPAFAEASKRKPQKCKPEECIKGELTELPEKLENQAGVMHA